jgi:hypothetical protein
MSNTIKCGDVADLAVVCAVLTEKGIAFNANTTTMIVTITGY